MQQTQADSTSCSIFDYTSAVDFLSQAFALKQKRRVGFTVRAWARELGLKNHAPLYDILQGKRPVPKHYVPLFVKSLKLKTKESRYFELLVDLMRARTPDEKLMYLRRIENQTKRKHIDFHKLESFRLLEDPLHMMLLEMTELTKYQADPAWISKHLNTQRSMPEIRAALARLIDLGLLVQEGDRYKKTHAHVFSQVERKDLALQEYHRRVSELARDAVGSQQVSEREFNSYSIAIRKEILPEAKARIREFLERFGQEFEAERGAADSVYQTNIQFFEVVRTTNPNEGSQS